MPIVKKLVVRDKQGHAHCKELIVRDKKGIAHCKKTSSYG